MRHSIVFLVLLLVSVEVGHAQTISITAVSPAALCPGDGMAVTYTTTAVFTGKNKFTAQLSDASGSFSPSFQNIGSLQSLGSGTISATIPADIAGGSHYRIRVISSTPYFVSPDNGSDLAVGVKPTVRFQPSKSSILEDDSVVFQNQSSGGASYAWNFGDGASPATSTDQNPVAVRYSTPGRKTISLTVTSASGCVTSYAMTPNLTMPFESYSDFEVLSCNPQIPHDAIVDSVDRDFGTGMGPVWVVPGTTFISETGGFVVYAEPGSSVQLPSTGFLTVYLKNGASYTGGATGSHRIIYAPGAGLNKLNHETLFPCSSLSFDYSTAPPYKIQHSDPAGVAKQATTTLSIYPNPAAKMLFVEAPESVSAFSLINALGEVVLHVSGGMTPRLQLDVSKYAAGTYMLELSFGTRQESRRIVLSH